MDSLWRVGLLYKLYKIAIGKNMLNIIKSQFENTLGAFNYQNLHTNSFNIDKGVGEGDKTYPV